MKTVTYDDTRDCAIRIIEKLNALGILPDTIFDEDIYFDIQDTITEEYNTILGLNIDDNFKIEIK